MAPAGWWLADVRLNHSGSAKTTSSDRFGGDDADFGPERDASAGAATSARG